MEKQDGNRQRGDLGEALKVAAGLTMAGLGYLVARHVVSVELQGFIVFDVFLFQSGLRSHSLLRALLLASNDATLCVAESDSFPALLAEFQE